MSSEQSEITERYIQGIQWSDRATEHEKALVAGNIRQFAHGVMRPLLMVRETEKKMLRADLAALREQLAAEEAGRQADADAARAQREADLQELARVRCRARHAEKDLAAKDATIAAQAAKIERLRERVRELEDNDAIGRRLTDGHLARIAELENKLFDATRVYEKRIAELEQKNEHRDDPSQRKDKHHHGHHG